jgi:hypothetical protein
MRKGLFQQITSLSKSMNLIIKETMVSLHQIIFIVIIETILVKNEFLLRHLFDIYKFMTISFTFN